MKVGAKAYFDSLSIKHEVHPQTFESIDLRPFSGIQIPQKFLCVDEMFPGSFRPETFPILKEPPHDLFLITFQRTWDVMLQFKITLLEQRFRLMVKLLPVQYEQTLRIFCRKLKLPDKSGRILMKR